MRVIVMGGAGDMGSRAAEDLAHQADISHVTLADRNTAAAHRVAERLKSAAAAVTVRGVDARDHADLVAAMKGHDVVASALGPFYEYEPRLVRAALEAGVDYASICDEWDAVDPIFERFAEAARETGRIVLTGLGASPGMTSVGVALLARRLDRVKKVEIACYQPLDAGGGEAVLRHMLHIMTGDVPVWRDGRRQMIPACSESSVVEFPRFGPIRMWNMGHSEPATVPRFFPEVEEVQFRMGYGRGAGWFVHPARWGLFASQTRLRLFAKALKAIESVASPAEPGWGALRVDVHGEKDGAPASHLLCGVGQMREATGLSLSVGVQMLARRELVTTAGGVYAPEGIIEPDRFVERLAAKGVGAFSDLEMKHSIAPAAATTGS